MKIVCLKIREKELKERNVQLKERIETILHI